jgi:O-glycosyl hydrolase
VALTLVLGACGSPTASPSQGTVVFDPTKTHQTIDGFGGSTAWTFSLPPAAVLQALFDPQTGAGLTLIRNRIPFREDTGNAAHTGYSDGFLAKDPGGHYLATSAGGHRTFSLNWSSGDLANTKAVFAAAQKYSSQVRGFSTAWSPPNNATDLWKVDNGSNTVGGSYGNVTSFPSIGGILDPGHYQDYADVLADYAGQFEAHMGYPLAGISVQNEPNWLPRTYESCGWSAAQFQAFLPALTSAWAAKGVTTAVILPESFTFTEDLVAGLVPTLPSGSIVGVHQYNATGLSQPGANALSADFQARWLPATKAAGVRLWETEVSTTGSVNDPSITDGLYWARMIHADLTVAEVNAWCAWWLWYPSPAALVDTSGSAPVYNKRLYTLGQFSRFVRPGWVRLEATNPVASVETTAFRDPGSTRFAVVLVNAGTEPVRLEISSPVPLAGGEIYRTSATEDLKDVGAWSVGTEVTLPGQSVTTVAGTLGS